MNEILEEALKEKNAEIATLKKELDCVKQALKWTHEKLVESEIGYRRAAEELVRLVEMPDPQSVKLLLETLDTKCGLIWCDRCQMAAKVIRQYARVESGNEDD